jgi:hypothetical protein
MKLTPKGVAEIAGTAGPVAPGIGAAASAGSRTLSRRCCRGAASGGERPLSGGKYTWVRLLWSEAGAVCDLGFCA